MIVYEIIYNDYEGEDIFKIDFVEKHKDKFKIIFNNKIYPLQSRFDNFNSNANVFKIKLMCFANISNLYRIFANFQATIDYYEVPNTISKHVNYYRSQKCFFRKIPRIIYEYQALNKYLDMIDDYRHFIETNFIQKEKGIKIFGKEFVERNKDKCIIAYKNRFFSLREYFFTKDMDKTDKTLEIFLIELKNINDFSYNFSSHNFSDNNRQEKEELALDPEDSKKFKDFYPDSNNIFENYSSISSDCKKKNFDSIYKDINDLIYEFPSTLTDMNATFQDCFALISLPDISKWNVKNVKYFDNFFCDCSPLISLNDISEWNLENAESLRGMFQGCSSLISLPDISKWNIENIIDISDLFRSCSSLISLPDISKWNITNLVSLRGIFDGCSLLITLPDISKWNIENIIDISDLFRSCSSLISLPDISKWNTKNLENIRAIFEGCSSLISIPNISIWNTKNLYDISSIFNGCSSLISLPDISKWNTKNVTKMNDMFYGCHNLLISHHLIFI